MPENYKDEFEYLTLVLSRIERRRTELLKLLVSNENRIFEQRRYM